MGRLSGIHSELGALARKSPNDGVNNFKLLLINEVVSSCNDLLGQQYRPLAGFTLFDPDTIPSNSDVTFIVAQYMESLEKFRADNVHFHKGAWCYRLKDLEEIIRTSAPEKLVRK